MPKDKTPPTNADPTADITTRSKLIPFQPDYTVPPGELLVETLEEQNIKLRDLARQSGVSVHYINQVIEGDMPITDGFAAILEEVTGIQSSLWCGMEKITERLF